MTSTKKNAPPDIRLRVVRGGGWGRSEPSWVRAASRSANDPAFRVVSVGFRCALRGREPLKVTP